MTKQMNTLLVALAFSASALVSNVAWADNGQCHSVAGEQYDYDVINEAGEKVGYVDQDPDGTWFTWANTLGTQNQTMVDFEAAVAWVCENGKAS